jgi:agmatine deiminase
MLAPTGADDPNAQLLTVARTRLVAAGYTVVDVPLLPVFEHEGQEVIAPHLNFYLCNGGAIVPVAGVDPDMDSEALKIIASAVPDREVVPVPMRAHPTQGGAVHCITQQVPEPAGRAAAG